MKDCCPTTHTHKHTHMHEYVYMGYIYIYTPTHYSYGVYIYIYIYIYIHTHPHTIPMGNPCAVMAKVLVCTLEVNEFEVSHAITFTFGLIIPLGKGINPPHLPAVV